MLVRYELVYRERLGWDALHGEASKARQGKAYLQAYELHVSYVYFVGMLDVPSERSCPSKAALAPRKSRAWRA